MQSERPKAAKATSPTRRQEPVRFDDTSHSPRKNPNGTKTAMFESVSTGPCPLFWNRRGKSSVRLCPKECGVIPRYRITTAASSTNRPTKTVRPIATAPYTGHFFRIRRITVNANDTTPITAPPVHQHLNPIKHHHRQPLLVRKVINRFPIKYPVNGTRRVAEGETEEGEKGVLEVIYRIHEVVSQTSSRSRHCSPGQP